MTEYLDQITVGVGGCIDRSNTHFAKTVFIKENLAMTNNKEEDRNMRDDKLTDALDKAVNNIENIKYEVGGFTRVDSGDNAQEMDNIDTANAVIADEIDSLCSKTINILLDIATVLTAISDDTRRIGLTVDRMSFGQAHYGAKQMDHVNQRNKDIERKIQMYVNDIYYRLEELINNMRGKQQ